MTPPVVVPERSANCSTWSRRDTCRLALQAAAAAIVARAPLQLDAETPTKPRIAGIATVYYPNSHAELILGRLMQGYTLEGRGEFPQLQLASLYLDQFPDNDTGRIVANRHSVPIFPNVAAALNVGGERLNVDGVMLIAEHGKYPESDTGQFVFPKRRLFAEVVKVCERSGRGVPVFLDKHLADNWTDAKWIYDEARRLQMPLMAGSTLPLLWRQPAHDVRRDAALREIVALSYHRLDSYGIHALEMVQALAERRRGGETGIRQVQTLRGAEVWRAIEQRRIDPQLLERALSTYKNRPVPRNQKLDQFITDPALMLIEYRDGLRASVLSLGTQYIDWTAAWRYQDDAIDAAVFWTQELRPFSHFGILVRELESFFRHGKPIWPVERTLLTTGALDALLVSRRDGGRVVETPHLAIAYHADWNWREPPPPAPDRPLEGP